MINTEYKPIANKYASVCADCGAKLDVATKVYWARNEPLICASCYEQRYAMNKARINGINETKHSYDETRDARITKMHEDKMKMLHDIVFAILELVEQEKVRNEYLKKEADR